MDRKARGGTPKLDGSMSNGFVTPFRISTSKSIQAGSLHLKTWGILSMDDKPSASKKSDKFIWKAHKTVGEGKPTSEAESRLYLNKHTENIHYRKPRDNAF